VNGVRHRTLDAVVLIEAAPPLVAGSLIAAGVGLGAGIPAIGPILAAFAPDGAPVRVYPGVGCHVGA
jgi:hypothetical protein